MAKTYPTGLAGTLEKTGITRLDYGGKISTDALAMAAGMIEMFDDMADLALSRIYVQTAALDQGFDLAAIGQDDIGRFKIAWLASLGELMFHGLAGQAKLDVPKLAEPKLAEVKRNYYAELTRSARERGIEALAVETAAAARAAIEADADFIERGIFSAPMSNDPDNAPRNRGLGPALAARMTETAFADSGKLKPILEAVGDLVEAEFNNAYAHGSVACAALDVR
jgi:hypothetical protein